MSQAGCPVDHFGLSPTGCPVSRKAAEFRAFDGPYQIDPASALKWSREDEPVFYSPDIGYWVVTRYEDVKAIFRDPILFSPSVALEKMTPSTPAAQEILKKYNFALQRTMVNEDEPDHMERRRLLLDDFLPEKLAKHEPAVRALCRKYMDAFIDRGHADLVSEIFHEIPLTIALHFLGVPDEGADQLRKFAVAHTLNTWGRPTEEEQLEIAENVGKFWQTANEILDGMIADPSGEGWMYETVRQHNTHPDIVPESYMRSMMMAILAAAHETTSNATSNAFWTLLNNRDTWEEICENPALIPSAVEECLRVAGSIIAWRRIATEETEVCGTKIPKGGKLLIVQASANKDPRHWENPDEVDIYRDNAVEHMSFGYGAHQCMGKNIARMEMRVFLEEFTRRLPHMHLAQGQAFQNLRNISFRGPTQLLVEWDPAQNPELNDPEILRKSISFPIGAPIKDDILRRLIVKEMHHETDGVRQIVLADPRGKKLPRWTPGSHLDLVSGNIRRKYSLCGDQNDTSTYLISVLREEEGRGGSMHICDTLGSGDDVLIAGPRNHFRLDETAACYTLIAGGIGITPIIAMADRLQALGKKYHLHYCGKSRSHMAMLERIQLTHGPALSLHIADEGTRFEMGAELGPIEQGHLVYSCGPERMLNELQELAARWPEGTLHFEYFTSGNTSLDPSKEHSFELELADSGMTLEVKADETVYDAICSAGIDIQMDCGEGLCGTCEAIVVGGEIDHRDRVLTKAERQKGDRIMTCCSRAKGKKLVLGI